MAELILLQIIRQRGVLYHEQWPRFLKLLPRPWSQTFTDYFLKTLERLISVLPIVEEEETVRELSMEWSLWKIGLPYAAITLPASRFDLALQIPPSVEVTSESSRAHHLATYVSQKILQPFVDTVHFRQRLLEEIERS